MTAVDVAHLDSEQLKLSLHYLHSVPPVPPVPAGVPSPFRNGLTNSPGSITTSVIIVNSTGRESSIGTRFPPGEGISIEGPTYDKPMWRYEPDGDANEQVGRAVLVSATQHDNIVELVLNLDGLKTFLRDGPLRPAVLLESGTNDGSTNPEAGGVITFDQQRCEWNINSNTATDAVPAPTSSSPSLPAPPQAQMPLPAIRTWAFQSPTGNIACHMSQTGAACDIKEHQYTAPTGPQTCAGFGDRLSLDIGTPGTIACHTSSFFDQPLPTQTYDVPLIAGPISCVLNESTGVTCTDNTTGHYFQLSKQSYAVG